MKVKRLFNLGMVIMMLVTSFAVSQPAAAEAPAKFTPHIAPGAEAVPGEIVVAFADSQGKNLVEKIEQAVDTANDAGGEVTRLSTDGSAVIQVDGDTTTALTEINNQPDVLYAELNYVYSVPPTEEATDEYKASSDFVFREVTPSASTNGMSVMATSNATIQGMVAMGTLPTDTYLSNNQGWFSIGADIVWPNATASANICEIDTGVDYLHPDLWYKYTKIVRGVRKTFYVYRVINGYDFVNGDALPMDDNGHGTHVAGIMVALNNNGAGVSGVSTGNVVAVKALDAQGSGTNFDIAKAIKWCADRTDVRVINLSLGGKETSAALEDALLYATKLTTEPLTGAGYPSYPGCLTTKNCVYGKGKLVIAAAGNNGSQTPVYPAAYAVDPRFPNHRILSVGATGRILPSTSITNYACKATFSNFGNWVTVAAPGYDIYSTTPYDKPFYQNYISGIATRYDFESGTSMAAAFVASAAARRMGYKPLETSEQIGADVSTLGDPMDGVTANCTPSEMQAVKRVNVATLLDRAAVRVWVYDAAAGIPLNGATVAVNYLNDGVSTLKAAVIAPDTYKPLIGEDVDPNRVYTDYISHVDIFDVPTVSTKGLPISNYKIFVNKAGYTVGYQNIFQQDDLSTLTAGTLNAFSNGAVPPLSKEFNVVLGWHKWRQVLDPNTVPPTLFKAAVSIDDLDLYVWLPDDNLGTDPAQPASFVVGYGGDSFGLSHVDGDSYGTMTDFPFARLKREGGYIDGGPTVETTTILQRVVRSGGTVLANANLPYYAGAYTIMATDYGQTIDHDNDGCGDNYGSSYKPVKVGGGVGYYDPTTDADCPPNDVTGTLGIPLLGAYFTPYAYVWKDGVVKYFQSGADGYGPWDAEVKPTTDLSENCNDHWWKAFSIFTTTTSTAPAYSAFSTPGGEPLCDDGLANGFIPYSGYTNTIDYPNDRLYITGLGK